MKKHTVDTLHERLRLIEARLFGGDYVFTMENEKDDDEIEDETEDKTKDTRTIAQIKKDKIDEKEVK